MTHLNPVRTGLAVGKTFALLHLIWSIFVAMGFGQRWVNFWMWTHHLNMPIKILPFDFTAAVTAIIISFIVGYGAGFAFAKFSNFLHR